MNYDIRDSNDDPIPVDIAFTLWPYTWTDEELSEYFSSFFHTGEDEYERR